MKQSTTMKGLWGLAALVTICTMLSGGRASAQVPDKLNPPAGAVEIQRALGIGVQIYHSAPNPTDPTKFVWTFFAPEASLFDDDGHLIIHHFGTPTGPGWQTNNGSEVIGKLSAAVPSPDGSAIPQLLLTGLSHAGNGLLSHVTFIQRLNTTNGVAPAELPTQLGQEARVPYTATYVFFNGPDGLSASVRRR